MTASSNRAVFLVHVGLLALLALAGPASAVIDPSGGVGNGPLAGVLTVTVIDELSGAPVAGAFCQVGPAPGSPFPGNLGFTNGAGMVVLTHAALTGPQTVTAGKEGYAYVTLVGVNAREMILPIRQKESEVPKALYHGTVSGMNPVTNDGQFDITVVVPALSIEDLTSLANFGQFSPIVLDTFPIAGAQPVPGLIYMPLQVEFLIIPMERSPYYMWLPDQTTQDLFTFYGRIPTSVLVELLGSPDPDFLPIIQSFALREYGLATGVVVNGDATRNLSVANNAVTNLRVNLSNTPSGYDVFTFAAADLDGTSGLGRIVPCGFGGAAGGSPASLQLATITPGGTLTGMNYLAGAIASDTTLGLSNSFVVDRSGLTAPDTSALSTFFRAPVLSTAGAQFNWTSVENPGVSPAPHLYNVQIALVKTIPDTNPGAMPGDTLDIPTPLWEFFLPATTTSLTVPRIGPNVAPGIPDPAGTADQDRLDWSAFGFRLGLPPAFDYNAWDLVDRAKKGTQIAWTTQTFIPFPDSLYTGVPAPSGPPPVLGEARPNPFRERTALALDLREASGPVRVDVFDASGRRVRSLDAASSGGASAAEVVWDGRGEDGRSVSPGNYFLRLSGGAATEARRVIKLPDR